jgi:outer membrane protein TolC
MINKLRAIALIIAILTFAGSVRAQETIFKDLSYPYLEKLIATAKANYPHMKVLDHQINIAKGTFHQSSFTWLDGFTASYIYAPEQTVNLTNPTYFSGIQLIASVSLGSLFEKPYTVHNAREGVRVAEEQKAEYELTLEANVKRFYFAYLEAQADLRNKVNAVTDATNAVNQLKHTFERGEISFQVYNEALSNLYNQTSFRLQAELAVFTAKTNLEELLGAKLESIK